MISTPGFDHGDGQSETPGWVAYDGSVYGQPFLASAGGGGEVGHDAVVAWLPEGERVVAIASNTPAITAEELLGAIGPSLISGERLPLPEVRPSEADPDEVAAIEGTYELESGGSFKVAGRDGRLAISAVGSKAIADLFPEHPGFTDGAVAAHEEHVSELLAGETKEGRKELAALESGPGSIDRIETVGTIVADGELRTYATIDSGSTAIVAWYALDERGGVGGADIGGQPPTLLFVPAGPGRYVPNDPIGEGPDLVAEFDGDKMWLAGPTGTVEARLAG
jgi:hypothetical protein